MCPREKFTTVIVHRSRSARTRSRAGSDARRRLVALTAHAIPSRCHRHRAPDGCFLRRTSRRPSAEACCTKAKRTISISHALTGWSARRLFYRAYQGIGGMQFPLTRRAGRLTLAAEDLLRQSLDQAGFQPLAVYSPHHADQLLQGGDAGKVLAASLQRKS